MSDDKLSINFFFLIFSFADWRKHEKNASQFFCCFAETDTNRSFYAKIFFGHGKFLWINFQENSHGYLWFKNIHAHVHIYMHSYEQGKEVKQVNGLTKMSFLCDNASTYTHFHVFVHCLFLSLSGSLNRCYFPVGLSKTNILYNSTFRRQSFVVFSPHQNAFYYFEFYSLQFDCKTLYFLCNIWHA